MKIELGKGRIIGFKFEHLTEGVHWKESMNYYVNQEGKIVSIHHDGFKSVGVKFRDGQVWYYPFEMAKDYIVKQEEDFEFNFTLDEPIVKSPFPIPNQYTKEDLIPNFLIGGYTSPKQNEVNRKMSESCKRIAEEINRIVTKHQNRKNMKNLKIEIPSGYEIDKEKSTFENIVFKPIKKELPKSWLELIEVHGYSVYDIQGAKLNAGFTSLGGKNIFATKEQAEASIALAQLSQLREVYRDGWKPNYNRTGQIKYVIYYERNRIQVNTALGLHDFLSFQSAEVRDLFLENFRDLIEQAKPLMS